MKKQILNYYDEIGRLSHALKQIKLGEFPKGVKTSDVYCLFEVDSFKNLSILYDRQNDCGGGFGTDINFWAFIDSEGTIYGAWDSWSTTLGELRGLTEEEADRIYKTKRLWADPNSPYSPGLDDQHHSYTERGEECTENFGVLPFYNNKFFADKANAGKQFYLAVGFTSDNFVNCVVLYREPSKYEPFDKPFDTSNFFSERV